MSKFRFPDWRVALATAVSATALLAACGGGGDTTVALDTAPTEVAASYAEGAITGFGSVIVGGVRYDDATCPVYDADGVLQDRSLLKLGMMIQVDGGPVDRVAGTAMALRIRFGGEVIGPVGAVDTTASTVQVLGQTVLVTESTVFDETLAGGLSALTAGAVVQVHGLLDTVNNRIVATRIEAQAAATTYQLRGVLTALDPAVKTFRIGTELISYAGLAVADVPATLADGQIVRVKLQTAQVSGAWVATQLFNSLRLPDARPDARIEGVISAFTANFTFAVNGLPVDASKAVFSDGTAGIVLGARVEVTGQVVNGVLVATKVEVAESRDFGRRMFHLHGDIGNVNTVAQTFELRGVTVSYSGTVVYRNGTQAQIANGKRAEVEGVLDRDRIRLQALLITF
ncbi:MAG: DUF5666 domain-containing protein [Rubrivivax sp.]|nr:DUF5666 domain-containing protein [Rubrivivax sp.]